VGSEPRTVETREREETETEKRGREERRENRRGESRGEEQIAYRVFTRSLLTENAFNGKRTSEDPQAVT